MKYVVSRNSNPVSVARDFDSLFNSLWNNWGVPSTKVPSVDIWEDEKAYVLEAELPGYSEKDVEVHVDKHVLKISSMCEAEKETKTEKEGPNYLVRERSCRGFERSFTLPEGINEDSIEGVFKNGVLKLTMPKVPATQPKKIDVKIK
ncbi:MAG: Hsp20/alpha crystallin family protein [Candidatus Wallbacteria bacterium HGW-Wallbacteria-1]|jgi:HSP20 family molecular chaperone IbpA|uniref:Hsp20/alpha crystallin family protein n=1 Tax=Candidatus Wallbacteria bacterium HGW-Wallbacteria-1 TaxID=2013854 RepID=A0A2N1PFW3_9BACT|nr:MAG: Hsp20/alpha crystallin family protein [Candidatus Wallbacteria bacterium HGW-Wallbacteria-1]PKL28639.1 MAG: Hsp20/alpha crystallin family protein [Spirochaetae bacterium HGW-Spirochaetae-2]